MSSLGFPPSLGIKLPKTQSAFLLGRSLKDSCQAAGSMHYQKSLCVLPSPVSSLHPALWEAVNYCDMPHAPPGKWKVRNLSVCIHQIHTHILPFNAKKQQNITGPVSQ